MSPVGRFAGRVAIVTGSSKGIGRAVAARIAAEGGAVVLNGRDADRLGRTAEQLRSGGASVAEVAGSISDPELPARLVDTAVGELGGVHVVVNNAATSAHYGPLLDADRDRFAATMLANTWPAVSLLQQAVRAGMPAGSAVVNISTTGAQRVHPVTAPYTASKAALEMLTLVLARELGPRRIRVNAVAPGLVRTDLAKVLWSGERGAAETRLVPLGRLGEPDDIARAVCFLASEDADWITGSVLRVDGGRMQVGGEPADLIGTDGQTG